MNILPLMLSSSIETPYCIDPLFLFRVSETSVQELVGGVYSHYPSIHVDRGRPLG